MRSPQRGKSVKAGSRDMPATPFNDNSEASTPSMSVATGHSKQPSIVHSDIVNEVSFTLPLLYQPYFADDRLLPGRLCQFGFKLICASASLSCWSFAASSHVCPPCDEIDASPYIYSFTNRRFCSIVLLPAIMYHTGIQSSLMAEFCHKEPCNQRNSRTPDCCCVEQSRQGDLLC